MSDTQLLPTSSHWYACHHTETQCPTHHCCQHHHTSMHGHHAETQCQTSNHRENRMGMFDSLGQHFCQHEQLQTHLPACHITYPHAISPTCMPYHLAACHITYLHAISIKCSVPHACRNVLSVELPLIHTIHGSLPIGPGQTAVGRPGLQPIMKNGKFWDLNVPSTAQGCLRTTYIF